MVKRKDAAQAAAKPTVAKSPSAKVAPPRPRPAAVGGVAEQQQPSKFRFATLLFRIGSLAFALYTLYKRMYPPPSPVDLDLDDKARIRHTPIERDPLRQGAVLEAFKVSLFLVSEVLAQVQTDNRSSATRRSIPIARTKRTHLDTTSCVTPSVCPAVQPPL